MPFSLQYPTPPNPDILSQFERQLIRKWFGCSYFYEQRWQKLESAMDQIAAVADGGNQPDNSGVQVVRFALMMLWDGELQENALLPQMSVLTVNKTNLNAAVYGLSGIRSVMIRHIGTISDALSCSPLRNVFDPVESKPDDYGGNARYTNYGV